MAVLIYAVIGLVVLYWVIRSAVAAGVRDAWKKRQDGAGATRPPEP
jgi:hypothetical protein